MISEYWLTPKRARLIPHDWADGSAMVNDPAPRRSRVFICGRFVFLAWHPLRPHGIYASIERNETGAHRSFAIGRLYAGFGRGVPTP